MALTGDRFTDEELGVSDETVISNSSMSSDMQEKSPDETRIPNTESSREEVNYEGGDIMNQQPAPPTETLKACLQVVGGFFLMFNSWGIANTFGAFQTYYESAILSSQSPSNISWIGSIQAFLLLFVGGLCTGQIYDAGHLRELVVVGSVLCVFGMMMTSICREYWQVLLAQGVTVGVGAGCLLLPSVAVFPQYFTHRRAFATGIAASGSSLGGVIYPIVFHKLQPRIGFGWATRVLAFIMLSTLLIPMTVMRAKSFPSTRRPFLDLKVLTDVPFVLFSIGEFFGFMGMYVPFYFISTYGFTQSIVDQNLSFYLLTILNTASIFGRLLPNFIADVIGPMNMMAPFVFFCAIVAFSWTSISSVGAIVLFCVFYGFFSGTFVSITGPALATLSPDISLLGTHMGMSFAFGALGFLVGNPVAGALLGSYGWIGPATFCGACNISAAIFVAAARVKKTGCRFMVKA